MVPIEMNEEILEAHDPKHVHASAAAVTAFLKATAERFAGLPLEDEPSGFQAEQRRSAP
jgi:hypothetical protein